MELNAEHEFWTIIEELASGRGRIGERAVYTNVRLTPLESEHVPEVLRTELKELKGSGAGAQRMSEDEAYNFVQRILSFYGKLRSASQH